MHDNIKCPECHKVINSVDTSKSFINCPFCRIRILIPKGDSGQHLSFHHRDLNDVTTEATDSKPTEKHSKFKINKERGAKTQKIDPLD